MAQLSALTVLVMLLIFLRKFLRSMRRWNVWMISEVFKCEYLLVWWMIHAVRFLRGEVLKDLWDKWPVRTHDQLDSVRLQPCCRCCNLPNAVRWREACGADGGRSSAVVLFRLLVLLNTSQTGSPWRDAVTKSVIWPLMRWVCWLVNEVELTSFKSLSWLVSVLVQFVRSRQLFFFSGVIKGIIGFELIKPGFIILASFLLSHINVMGCSGSEPRMRFTCRRVKQTAKMKWTLYVVHPLWTN